MHGHDLSIVSDGLWVKSSQGCIIRERLFDQSNLFFFIIPRMSSPISMPSLNRYPFVLSTRIGSATRYVAALSLNVMS